MKQPARAPLGHGAAAAGLTALCWSCVLRGSFLNWDDLPVVTANARLSLPLPALVHWAFTTTYNSAYQPAGWLLFAFLRGAFGSRPEVFHAFNLLAWSAAAAGAYALAWTLLRNARAALLAALAFSLHPGNVELIATASGCADALAVALVAWAAWAFSSRKDRLCLVLTCCGALVRWQSAMIVPAALALGLYHGELRAAARRAVPLALITGASAAAMAFAKRSAGFSGTGAPASAFVRAAILFVQHWLAPLRLSPFYVLSRAPAGLSTGTCALACAALTAAAFGLRRRFPAVWPAWLFSLASIAPTALMSEGGRAFYHDRYGVFACAALALCLAAALRAGLERKRGPAPALAAALVFALALGARAQAASYRDSVSLWSAAAEVDPDEPLVYNRLGEALADEAGRPCEARAAFERQAALDDTPTARSLVEQARALCEAQAERQKGIIRR